MPKESITRKKAVQSLEEAGWLCWYPPKVKFQQSDIFGIIDLLALKGRQKKNIQLTTLPNLSTRRRKILSFLKAAKVDISVEIWAWDSKQKNFKKEKVSLQQSQNRTKEA